MLVELRPAAFEKVRAQLAPLCFRLDLVAVLENSIPGRVWVDDPERPRAAFLAAPTVYFVAGETGEGFCEDVNRLITERIFIEDPLGRGRKAVRIVPEPRIRAETMDLILAGREPIRARRRSYLHHLSPEPADFPIPEGCEFRTMDESLLADPAIDVEMPFVVRTMESSFGTVERFLAESFMVVAVLDGRTVAYAVANYVVGSRCELGIVTAAEYRRRGLGVATTAAGLRRAKALSMTTVSWQCGERNPGSIRIAEQVGFQLECEYTGYMVVGDEEIHEEVLAQWRQGQPVF